MRENESNSNSSSAGSHRTQIIVAVIALISAVVVACFGLIGILVPVLLPYFVREETPNHTALSVAPTVTSTPTVYVPPTEEPSPRDIPTPTIGGLAVEPTDVPQAPVTPGLTNTPTPLGQSQPTYTPVPTNTPAPPPTVALTDTPTNTPPPPTDTPVPTPTNTDTPTPTPTSCMTPPSANVKIRAYHWVDARRECATAHTGTGERPPDCQNVGAGDPDGSVLLGTLNSGVSDPDNTWSFVYGENSEESLVEIEKYYDRPALKVWFFFLVPDEDYPAATGVLQEKPNHERLVPENGLDLHIRFLEGIRPILFSVGPEYQGDLEASELSSDFQKAFESHGIILSQDLTIIKPSEEVDNWQIEENDTLRKYFVSKKGEVLNIYGEDLDYQAIGAEYQKFCSKDGAALIGVAGYINHHSLHKFVETLP